MASDQEPQHPATERQRERFAERGEIVRSRDLSGAVVLAGAMLSLGWIVPTSVNLLIRFTGETFARLSMRNPVSVTVWQTFLTAYWSATAPLVGCCVFTAVLVGWAQSRGVKMRSLEFDLSRLDPLPKLKQLFGFTEALPTLLWSLCKVAVVGGVCGTVLYQHMPLLAHTQPSSLHSIWTRSLSLLSTLATRGMFTLLGLGMVDYIMAYFKLEKRMRMTHQEVRDEMKEDVGDPRLRSKRRRKHQELVKKRSLHDVPKADVVLVNPTHYAVALVYKAQEMGAPRLLAKGADGQAERIRAVARRHGIPIVVQPALTRLVYAQVAVGKQIPEDLYQAVAVVLAHVYRVRRRAG